MNLVSHFLSGNDGLNPQDHYIRMVDSLVRHWNIRSEHLFGLVTNGGAEYCGAVIDQALTKLNWQNDKNAINVIIVAGNEPFDQGIIDYKTVCKKASAAGIKINTIYCGNPDNGESKKYIWRDGATLGNGSFMFINQDSAARKNHLLTITKSSNLMSN